MLESPPPEGKTISPMLNDLDGVLSCLDDEVTRLENMITSMTTTLARALAQDGDVPGEMAVPVAMRQTPLNSNLQDQVDRIRTAVSRGFVILDRVVL